MPVPYLVFGAFTLIAGVLAPPSILLTAPVWILVLQRHRSRARKLRAAKQERAAAKLLEARMDAARWFVR